MEEEKSFARQYADKVKKDMLDNFDSKQEREDSLKHWRAWGSWFSWGSPVGLGLFLLSIGVFLVLLHFANIIG